MNNGWYTQDQLLKPLQQVMDPMLECLESTELDEAADAIGAVMLDCPAFYTPEQHAKIATIITGPWAALCVQQVLSEAFDEMPRLVRLMLTYVDHHMVELAEQPENIVGQEIMSMAIFSAQLIQQHIDTLQVPCTRSSRAQAFPESMT